MPASRVWFARGSFNAPFWRPWRTIASNSGVSERGNRA